MALTFNVIGGRAYTVEEATDLLAQDWKPRAFFIPGSDAAVNVLAAPSGAGRTTSTVYLLPEGDKAFFRVRAE